MQKNFFLKYLFTIFLSSICLSPGNTQTNKPVLQLYHCTGDFPPNTLQYLKKLGIPKVPIFDGRYLDPENDQQLNTELLKQAVLNEIPNPIDTGLAILDWEGNAFTTLYTAAATSDSFKAVFSEYKKALTICQQLRPKMKWGYYHIPVTDYWLDDTLNLQKVNQKLLPLMQQCGILFPSMYNHYPDSTKFTHNDYYIYYNIQQALKIGIRLKKKVVPFVWHRWHEGNEKVGLKLIPEQEFYSSLKRMLDIKVSKRRIDGLMWFAGDSYFLNIKPSLLLAENPNNKSIAVYYDDIVKEYTLLFLKIKKYYSKF